MSTVKTNNVQIGQSVTATNNATWYQPATPDGTVRLGVGNAGATTADILIANSSGNLGLGVTPSAWGVPFKAIEGGDADNQAALSFQTNVNAVNLHANSYYNGGYKYKFSGTAGQYVVDGNTHAWYNAPSGTAGNAISFTQAMTLDASGNLGIGTSSPSTYGQLSLYRASGDVEAAVVTGGANYATYRIQNSTNRYSMQIRTDVSNAWVLRDETNSANRLVVDTSGNLLVGTTTSDARLHVVKSLATIAWMQNGSGTGVALYAGNSSWTGTSDETVKDIIEPIIGAVSKVNVLRSVIGKFKDDKSETRRAFLIAQDVQKVLPEAVSVMPTGKLGIQYTDTIPLLVAAIKELSAELNELKQRIN